MNTLFMFAPASIRTWHAPTLPDAAATWREVKWCCVGVERERGGKDR